MMIHKLTDLAVNSKPLVPADLPVPVPGPGEILLRVHACGVCHTELDEIEGRTPPPVLPVIPGHQVIGVVEARGQGSELYNIGDRLGVAWIYASCGHCEYCLSGRENLCPGFRATGRDVNGGYAEFMVAGEKFAYPIPEIFSDEEAAPLLCAPHPGGSTRSQRRAFLRRLPLQGPPGRTPLHPRLRHRSGT